VRSAEPVARVIYLEPDIFRAEQAADVPPSLVPPTDPPDQPGAPG
jgi:hypothetical protein